MSRTTAFATVSRARRIAEFCERHNLPTRVGLEIAAQRAEAAAEARQAGVSPFSRRDFLRAGTIVAAAAGASWISAPARALTAGHPRRGRPRIAIIGGGLAGLVCADRLRAKGHAATIYEAADRLGGRCWSLRGFFPGQTAERGGEFIDTTHQTMRQYAVEFGLAREDVTRNPGEVFYFFGGQRHGEEAVVDEYRVLVRRMRPDLRASSGSPTFYSHNQADIVLDHTDLATYLATRGAGLPLIQAVLDEAYVAEYGLETHEQSCLNMLLFLHLDRRRRFAPFGVFSDERFHLVDGNDAIVQNIAARLPGPIETGMRLVGLRRNALGEYEMTFDGVGQPRVADAVVLTIPFTVLREVDLHPSLGLSAEKLHAINTLGYGTNAKTMIGFTARPWRDAGSNGSAYSDLPDVQTFWETNASRAAAGRAVLTDYAGGDRGRDLLSRSVQHQVSDSLIDLDVVFPGAQAAARVESGQYVAHREHWPSNPLARGGYTCYTPGQFTGLAGLEGEQAGPLKFAGEHADSFYDWQGFMEGACLSGARAAGEILADIRARRL